MSLFYPFLDNANISVLPLSLLQLFPICGKTSFSDSRIKIKRTLRALLTRNTGPGVYLSYAVAGCLARVVGYVFVTKFRCPMTLFHGTDDRILVV